MDPLTALFALGILPALLEAELEGQPRLPARMPWADDLNRRDARRLASWWNANHRDRFFVEPSLRHLPSRARAPSARWRVVREPVEKGPSFGPPEDPWTR